jgi:NAD(P)H-dependent FMN reductase
VFNFPNQVVMKKFLMFAFLACTITISPLFAEARVLAFAGSTRADSVNKKLIADAAKMAREMGATVTVIDLQDYLMPFYDADLEMKQGMPKNAKRLRELMINNDAIIIASPEYNSSLSALLKNALDWASRSEDGGSSREAFKGKRFAIMAASPGKGGGSRGLVHLRSVIEDVGGTVVSKQVTIPNAYQYFSEKNDTENTMLKEELQQLLQL